MSGDLPDLVAELRERLAVVRRGGSESARQKHLDRGKLLVRDRVDRLLDPGSPFLELSPLAAFGMYGEAATTLRRARRQHRHRHRPDQRPRVRGGRQRRDGQGRHLLPDDGQEAPARPAGRRRQPAAVRLPRRLRRRLPADAGRGVPRPRALRPDLLQPGQPVGARHPADRLGDGLVHGRRRLRAGDVRRERDRQGPGHDLPRRPAAGEGRDRRGGHRRGARRGRRTRPEVRRRRPPGRGRRARAGDRAVDRRHAAASRWFRDRTSVPSSTSGGPSSTNGQPRSRSRTRTRRRWPTSYPPTPGRRTTSAR